MRANGRAFPSGTALLDFLKTDCNVVQSGGSAASGGPANRLIARLRGRALKSVTPHQFFSNPSLHSVEETDIDTGQKTTKVLFGETNLDEVR